MLSIPEHIREWNNHIEEYKNHTLVRSVIGKETSFVDEVREFYDIEITCPLLVHESDIRLKEEDPQKRDTTPDNLTEILKEFANVGLNKERLQYDSVRENYEKWRRKNKMYNIIGTAGILVGGSGAIAGAALAPEVDITNETTNALIGLGVPITAGGIGSLSYSPNTNKNYELTEFLNLHKAAERADNFINHFYLKSDLNSNK